MTRPSFPPARRVRPGALLLLCGLLAGGQARAHGPEQFSPMPAATVSGIERGIALAARCDHAIHELLGEYEYCMRANHDYIAGDAAAETAFQFMAWLRASGAARNGYPDGPGYREKYSRSFAAAQSRHAIAPLELCKAVKIDCAMLPEAVPEPAADRSD